MINIRIANDRGHADHGWLNSRYTFSFAEYRDPRQLGFRSLRVMNEDRVAPSRGFGTHGHSDMEIVSYVLEGALEHNDSMGNGAVLAPGEFQRITAGTGITHSEFNASDSKPTHFYQIWIHPERKGLAPSYEQKSFDPKGRRNRWQLVASRNAADGSLLIHQDVCIYLLDLDKEKSIEYPLNANRHVWMQVLRGSATVNEQSLTAGDGAAVSDESVLHFTATMNTEIMLMDLA